MSIEEMVFELKEAATDGYDGVPRAAAEAIIAALRAAQEMRSYLSVKPISDGQVVATIRSGYAGNLAKTLQAFDAATGGAK